MDSCPPAHTAPPSPVVVPPVACVSSSADNDTGALVWEALRPSPDGVCVFDPDKFVQSLQVTPEDRVAIAAFEQRSDAWRRARFGRLTASNFGAAAGHHLSGAASRVLKSMLWPEDFKLEGKAAAFAEWGTTMENVAKDIYTRHRRHELRARSPGAGHLLVISETGLLVSEECGWLAASPDFVVDEPVFEGEGVTPVTPVTPANPYHARAPYIIDHVDMNRVGVASDDHVKDPDEGCPPSPKPYTIQRGCGEIKCPASHKLYSVSGKHDEHQFPKYYYDQIQGTMAINGWPWCDTVVTTPTQTEVIRFYFNAPYWTDVLLPLLRAFYFKTFLPRLVLRAQGRLRPGETEPLVVPLKAVTQQALASILAGKSRKPKRRRADTDAATLVTSATCEMK